MSVAACACMVKGSQGAATGHLEGVVDGVAVCSEADREVLRDDPCGGAGLASRGGRGSEKGTIHLVSVFASSCLRIARGKVCRPYSFLVSEPMCRVE